MIFEKTIMIPLERVGVLIGKSGKIKVKIEKICSVSLLVDGKTGEIIIRGMGDVESMMPFKAEEIVMAIGRGFSAEKSMRLLEGENSLHIIDLREFAGKSSSQIERIRGDRKSTRLNSSHGYISYAVFCLKKKKPYSHKYPPPLSN